MSNVTIKSVGSAAVFAGSIAALLVACSSKDSSTPAPATAGTSAQSLVKCAGINTCKGTSACAGGSGGSGCEGMNDCAGKGWIEVPQTECDSKKGTVLGKGAPAAPTASASATTAPTAAPTTAPTVPTIPPAGKVKCSGINTCSGTSDCATKDSSCKGMNSCAGKGYVLVPSEAECTAKKGTVI
jgi:hypothetical protein